MGTTTTDSRGVTIFLSDDEARMDALTRLKRSEEALDIADARGWPLNDSDAARVQADLDEAVRLLTDIGEYKQLSGPVDLSRFYAPGESEAILAARATAEERRRELVRRMAETALMIDELGADDEQLSADATGSITPAEAAAEPERVNIKREQDAAGTLWVVSGRGETKRFATLEVAEREARRRVGRA